jgi:hypothetical protein
MASYRFDEKGCEKTEEKVKTNKKRGIRIAGISTYFEC